MVIAARNIVRGQSWDSFAIYGSLVVDEDVKKPTNQPNKQAIMWIYLCIPLLKSLPSGFPWTLEKSL